MNSKGEQITYLLLTQALKLLRLPFLLLILFDLTSNTPPLGKVESSVLRCPVLRLFSLLILPSQLQRSADLVYEAREFAGGLGCHGFDVSLEDEEILGFDEDIVGDESGVVGGVGDDFIVEFVFRGASGGYSVYIIEPKLKLKLLSSRRGKVDLRALEIPLFLVQVHEDSENPGLLRCTFTFAFLVLFIVLFALCIAFLFGLQCLGAQLNPIPRQPSPSVDKIL